MFIHNVTESKSIFLRHGKANLRHQVYNKERVDSRDNQMRRQEHKRQIPHAERGENKFFGIIVVEMTHRLMKKGRGPHDYS